MKYAGILFIILMISVALASSALGQTTPARVAGTLQKLQRDKATPQTLWNMGFILFYRYGADRDLAKVIADGYQAAAGEGENQNELFKRAALFWNREYEYWNKKRPGDRYARAKDEYYWLPRRDWESNLKKFRTGQSIERSKYARTWKYHSQYERHWSRGWDSTLKMYRSRSQ